MRDLGFGILLTVVVTALMVLAWGREALIPGLSFGLLATAIHVAAVALLKPALTGSYGKLMSRWGMGMGLRLVGVGMFALAVLREPQLFPALPTAVGYLAVLIPLLFFETRLLR